MTRSTKQRRAIRAVFERLNRPLSPQEILDQVGGEVEGIGIATVYRTIKSFVEEVIIVSVDVPGEPARYELAGKGHHHHFRCTDCGSVYEIEGCVGNFKALTPPGFLVKDHEVWLYGSCSTCRASAGAA